MRVDSRMALEDLLVILTAHYSRRDRAVFYLTSALTCKEPNIEADGLNVFGYGERCVDVPTLGEWLSERGITVKWGRAKTRDRVEKD